MTAPRPAATAAPPPAATAAPHPAATVALLPVTAALRPEISCPEHARRTYRPAGWCQEWPRVVLPALSARSQPAGR
jgi:hypothetical protein